MNADDRALAAKIAREAEQAILALGRRGRVLLEAQTDAKGHVRSYYEIRIVVSLAHEALDRPRLKRAKSA